MRLEIRTDVSCLVATTLALLSCQAAPEKLVQQPAVVVRHEVHSLACDSKTLMALRSAIGNMRDPALHSGTDPLNWIFLANEHEYRNKDGQAIHPEDEAVLDEQARDRLWAKAEHFSEQFGPWHRAQLAYVEALVREIAHAPDFAMPYWDAFAFPALPTCFTDRTFQGGPNALFDETRPAAQTSVTQVTPDRSPKKAMLVPVFLGKDPDAFGGRGRTTHHSHGEPGFLELETHNWAHDHMGGDMGDIGTAARDPLFYVYHANIDRLWEVWRHDPSHADPAEASWLNAAFSFPNPFGQGDRTFVVQDMLDTAKLGYRYDDIEHALTGTFVPPPLPPAPPIFRQAPAKLPGQRAAHQEGLTYSLDSPLVLTGDSITIEMELPQAAVDRIRQLGSKAMVAANPVVELVLERPQADSAQGASYNVLVNLPAQPGPGLDPSQYFVGTLGSWDVSMLGHSGETDLHYVLDSTISGLIRADRWPAGNLRVSFVRTGLRDGQGKFLPAGPGPVATIPRLYLLVR